VGHRLGATTPLGLLANGRSDESICREGEREIQIHKQRAGGGVIEDSGESSSKRGNEL